MSSWRDLYRSRLTTPEEAVDCIRPGGRVYIHPGAAEPETIVRALIERAPHLANVEIIHLLTLGDAGYVRPGMEGRFRHTAMFVGANVREAVNTGRADYMPISLSEVPRLFTSGLLPIDACLIQASPPDEHGYCSFGVGVDCTMAATDVARAVIAQVNAEMPRTMGDSFIHVSKLDRIVEVSRPLLELPRRPADELRRGKIVSAFLMGSRKLYEFVHNNPIIELHPTEYTNDPFIIAANDRMVAINSALQVDLTGQVCGDSMGTGIYSGVGGHPGFREELFEFAVQNHYLDRSSRALSLAAG